METDLVYFYFLPFVFAAEQLYSFEWEWGVLFSQSMHRQASVQAMPALKHSQYFFWHWDFLQMQPGLLFRELLHFIYALVCFTSSECSCVL